MNELLQRITKRLNEIVALENTEPLDILGSYIIGLLVVDDAADELCDTNLTLARIAKLGSDLEIVNGGEQYMQEYWDEVKQLVATLNQANSSPKKSN